MNSRSNNTYGFVLCRPAHILNHCQCHPEWKCRGIATSAASRWATGTSSRSKLTFLPNQQQSRSSTALIRCEATTEDSDPLNSNDFLTRIRAINDRRHQEVGDVITALVPLAANDKNAQIRYSAISQLAGLDRAELNNDQKTLLLSTALDILKNDTDSSCQSGAADVIAGLGLADGFDTLVETYGNTKDWMLKVTIAAGMGEIGDPRAYDFLKESVGDAVSSGDELLLAALIGALGDIRNPDGLTIVETYLKHPDAAIRRRAEIAVELLKGA